MRVEYSDSVRFEATQAMIRAFPDASSREVADRLGVSHPYVIKLKKELVAGGEVPDLDSRGMSPEVEKVLRKLDFDELVAHEGRSLERIAVLERQVRELGADPR